MPTALEQLKQSIREALPELDMVIAWTRGPDDLRHTPLFVTEESEVERIDFDPRCSAGLAGYLPGLRGKKVGIVAKGCDARTIVELLQENLIDRADVTIFGLHCEGVIDPLKVREAMGGKLSAPVESCEVDGHELRMEGGGVKHMAPLADVLAEKCFRCTGADADPCDHFAGEHGAPPALEPAQPCTLDALEAMDMEQRFRFWEESMDRCIRCYACRSACPLCVCRDHCAAQSRDPHWVDQMDHPREKLMFQVIHALHTAGRCTECGECERACPMDLPVMTLKQALNRQIKDLFDYQAGTDPEATPPLFQFREEEERIEEKKW
jgi:ferredoxin